MSKLLHFKVSAAHVAPKYAHHGEIVTAELNLDGWCYVGRLGCGKTYQTPQRAIENTLREHGCTMISIAAVPALDN